MTESFRVSLIAIRAILSRHRWGLLVVDVEMVGLCMICDSSSWGIAGSLAWAMAVLGQIVTVLAEGHRAAWKWARLRPVSTVRLAQWSFASCCARTLLPWAVGYVLYGAFGWLETQQGHELLLVTVLVLLPILNGLVLAFGGGGRVFLAGLGAAGGLYLAWAWFDAPPWMSPHVWNLLWFLMSAGLGYGVAIAGVTRGWQGGDAWEGAGCDWPEKWFRRGVRRPPAFANAEDAEVWLLWQYIWAYCPVLFLVAPFLGVGLSIWDREIPRMSGDLALLGPLVFLILVAVVGSQTVKCLCVKELPQTRTLSNEALTRCLFRGAARGLLATTVVALVCAAAWVLASRDAALVASIRVHPVDAFIVVAYGAMAAWAATWAGISRHAELSATVLVMVAGLLALIAPFSIRVLNARPFDWNSGPSFGELLGTVVWIAVIGGAVGYPVWAFAAARRRGLVSDARCAIAGIVGFALIALPLLHCPVWFGMWSVPARLMLVTVIVGLALAPFATVPLACERARGGYYWAIGTVATPWLSR